MLRFALNLLWFVLGGWLCALEWLLAGALLALTIVGIPFAFGAFRIAGFVAWPYGREAVHAELLGEERIFGTALANLLWIVLAGIWLALSHILLGILQCLTIILIPVAFQHFKLAELCFAPLGRRVVSKETATLARERACSHRAMDI